MEAESAVEIGLGKAVNGTKGVESGEAGTVGVDFKEGVLGCSVEGIAAHGQAGRPDNVAGERRWKRKQGGEAGAVGVQAIEVPPPKLPPN